DGIGFPLVLGGHENLVSATWSRDGASIATASRDGILRVFCINNLETSAPTFLRGHENTIYRGAFSPDNQRIVTASMHKTARVWNADGSGLPIVLRGHEGPINTAEFSPDNQHIVTASDDKTVRVWNADGSGQPVVLHHEGMVWTAAFSPDSRRIVTASDDK